LPRAASRMALRLRARRALPLGAAGGDERLQGAAAPLGEGLDPGGAKAPSTGVAGAPPAGRQGGGHVPSDLQRGLRLPAPPLAPGLSGRAGALSKREPALHDRRYPSLRRGHELGPLLLRVRAAGDEAGLEAPAAVPSVRDVSGDGP